MIRTYLQRLAVAYRIQPGQANSWLFCLAEKQPKSIFVVTQHGGHLGYYEGGVVPNRLSWLDKLVVEFSRACIQANQDTS
jgi:hypothetical protein